MWFSSQFKFLTQICGKFEWIKLDLFMAHFVHIINNFIDFIVRALFYV